MALKVFLDMDGVLVDFVGGLHRALGVSFDPKNYPYPASKYDMFEDLCARSDGKVNMSNLYRACDAAEFWANLEWDPVGNQILATIADVLGDMKDVIICTSPMTNPDAWKGKIQWLNKNAPEIKNISITTASKHLYAKPGHVLIDDKDSNIDQFVEHGGAGFLVPQPWNSARDNYDMDYVWDLEGFLYQQIEESEMSSCSPKRLFKALGL